MRLFRDEVAPHLDLVLDVSASMGFGTPRKADHAAQLAATLAMIALGHRDPVVLACFGGELHDGDVTQETLGACHVLDRAPRDDEDVVEEAERERRYHREGRLADADVQCVAVSTEATEASAVCTKLLRASLTNCARSSAVVIEPPKVASVVAAST